MKGIDKNIDILKKETSHDDNELWKYYIDSRDWDHGKRIYDTGNREGVSAEYGYLARSMNAFNQFVLDPAVAEQPLSIDTLDQIHATHLTQTLKNKGRRRISPRNEIDRTGGMDKSMVYVSLADKRHINHINLSLLNLIDIATIYIRANPKDMQTHGLFINNSYQINELDFYSLGVQSDRLQDILNTYEKAISEANTLPEKTRAISLLIKSLEVLHPWSDGNARTLCMTLLYKECVRNGLFPPFQKNPNIFDSISAESLSKHILEQSHSTEKHFNNKHSHSKTSKENLPTYSIPEEKPREELHFKHPLQESHKEKLSQDIQNINFPEFKTLLDKHGVFKIYQQDKYDGGSISHINLKHLKNNLEDIIALMTDEITNNVYSTLNLSSKNTIEVISTLSNICEWRNTLPELKQHKLYNKDSLILWKQLSSTTFAKDDKVELYIHTKQFLSSLENDQRSKSLKTINDIFLQHLFIKMKKHFIGYIYDDNTQDKYKFVDLIRELTKRGTLEENSAFIITGLSQKSAGHPLNDELICHFIRATKEYYDNTIDAYTTPQKNYHLQQNSPLLKNLIEKKGYEILMEISLSDFLSPAANKKTATMV